MHSSIKTVHTIVSQTHQVLYLFSSVSSFFYYLLLNKIHEMSLGTFNRNIILHDPIAPLSFEVRRIKSRGNFLYFRVNTCPIKSGNQTRNTSRLFCLFAHSDLLFKTDPLRSFLNSKFYSLNLATFTTSNEFMSDRNA